MKITIQDVAKKAEVSVATVSRVLNGNYPVKAETKEKVQKVIKELNFIPNIQARELTRQKSTAIGVVLPSINNMFFPEVVTSIETALKAKGYSLILCCSNNDKDEEARCINDLLARNVAGVIVLDPNTSNINSAFYESISKTVPVVFINGHASVENISSVSNDESIGAELALKYLPNGSCGVVSFGIKGGRKAAEKFMKNNIIINNGIPHRFLTALYNPYFLQNHS